MSEQDSSRACFIVRHLSFNLVLDLDIFFVGEMDLDIVFDGEMDFVIVFVGEVPSGSSYFSNTELFCIVIVTSCCL